VAVTQSHIVNLLGVATTPGATPVAATARGGFLKCQISILVRDEELGKAMGAEKPTPESEAAKAIVFEALSAMTTEDAIDPDARSILRQDILGKLNARFRSRPSKDKKKVPLAPGTLIKEVLIVEWAVQR